MRGKRKRGEEMTPRKRAYEIALEAHNIAVEAKAGRVDGWSMVDKIEQAIIATIEDCAQVADAYAEKERVFSESLQISGVTERGFAARELGKQIRALKGGWGE